MKLYHGTNVDFDEIDLTKSNKYKDFGQGFYLTDIRSQPRNLVFSGVIQLFKNMNLTKHF
jgi:hypothetical protein